MAKFFLSMLPFVVLACSASPSHSDAHFTDSDTRASHASGDTDTLLWADAQDGPPPTDTGPTDEDVSSKDPSVHDVGLDPTSGCDLVCSEHGLAIINDCFVDPSETLSLADCHTVRISEEFAEMGECLTHAQGCDDGLACFAGPAAAFDVQGSDAVMNGVIGPEIGATVDALLTNHPEVTRIVLVDCPGSMDDVANLMAARKIRTAGLATHVPAGGVIASGAVDFFLAGLTRTADIAGGAKLGVHTWGSGNLDGSKLPKDHPEHQRYLNYYAEMGIDEAFYGFTLQAAGPDDIHYMTAAELEQYDLLTD